MAKYIQQDLQLATTNAQLAILSKFSNDPKEDRTSATERLQKLINNKQGGGWTDLQTVTHFRSVLRGEVFKWYTALPLLNVDSLNLEVVKTQFKQDFRTAPTI
jgi:hypothetical protein